MASLPQPLPQYKVSILQLVGSWNKNHAPDVMQRVSEHNHNHVKRHYGFDVHAVTNVSELVVAEANAQRM